VPTYLFSAENVRELRVSLIALQAQVGALTIEQRLLTEELRRLNETLLRKQLDSLNSRSRRRDNKRLTPSVSRGCQVAFPSSLQHPRYLRRFSLPGHHTVMNKKFVTPQHLSSRELCWSLHGPLIESPTSCFVIQDTRRVCYLLFV